MFGYCAARGWKLESVPSDRNLLVNDGAGDITGRSCDVDDLLFEVVFVLTPKRSK